MRGGCTLRYPSRELELRRRQTWSSEERKLHGGERTVDKSTGHIAQKLPRDISITSYPNERTMAIAKQRAWVLDVEWKSARLWSWSTGVWATVGISRRAC